jgi:hypothetical protein
MIFSRQLKAMQGLLAKLEAHCEAKKVDTAVLLNSRLALDMFPFVRQVQLTCDFAKNTCARLTGETPPAHPDTEVTLDELRARVDKTLAYVESLPAQSYEAGATREITFPIGPDSKMTLPGAMYLSGFALPNFYFHMSMAYAILRHNGVEIGKREFMGI